MLLNTLTSSLWPHTSGNKNRLICHNGEWIRASMLSLLWRTSEELFLKETDRHFLLQVFTRIATIATQWGEEKKACVCLGLLLPLHWRDSGHLLFNERSSLKKRKSIYFENGGKKKKNVPIKVCWWIEGRQGEEKRADLEWRCVMRRRGEQYCSSTWMKPPSQLPRALYWLTWRTHTT